MTTPELILSLICICLLIFLYFSVALGVRAKERAWRDDQIALAYIRDAAEFRTVDEFARIFLEGGVKAAEKAFPHFAKFRAERQAADAREYPQ